MAFQNKNLSVIAYANGFTLWHYASADEKMNVITTAGYFDSVKTLMNVGDVVIINASDNTSMKKVSATSENVTLAALA